MRVGSAGHGEHLADEVLVLFTLPGFPDQVVVGTEGSFFHGGHGDSLATLLSDDCNGSRKKSALAGRRHE